MADVETRTDSHASMLTVLVGLAVTAVVVVFATLEINLARLLRWNPRLSRRRMRLGKGTKAWDKVWSVLFALMTIAI